MTTATKPAGEVISRSKHQFPQHDAEDQDDQKYRDRHEEQNFGDTARAAATPVKPKKPAMSEMTKKMRAHLIMNGPFR